MKPIITVIGSYAVGLTMRVPRFPTEGETLKGHSFKQMHGGKGSNQAIGCARLGAEVNFISCIGRDILGDVALALYKEEGLRTDYIKLSKNYSTGVGFIIVNECGQNIITLDLGANFDLTPEYISSLSHVIDASQIVLMQMEIPSNTIVTTARIASKKGIKTILDPSPYQPLPNEVWENINIITPNEKDAKLILGYDPVEKIDIRKLGHELLEKGVDTAIITLGEKGSYYTTSEDSGFIPANSTEVVDTTGAGDTFTAALGVAIIEGKNLHEAIQFASYAASLSVSKYGVIEALPNRDDVEKYKNDASANK